ncbi:hypothetical protein Scep_030485 [Stephania cephalantha]|uniref:Uncharacterized protein n=1 Tax=Stephania cephalantha TaxID=152367 RepID=A0AAP0HED9_9MAGN
MTTHVKLLPKSTVRLTVTRGVRCLMWVMYWVLVWRDVASNLETGRNRVGLGGLGFERASVGGGDEMMKRNREEKRKR